MMFAVSEDIGPSTCEQSLGGTLFFLHARCVLSATGWIVCGAVVGALGVGIGAFGAHWLGPHLEKTNEATDVARLLATFETGARYQMYHAPMLVLVGLLLARGPCTGLQIAGVCFLLGVVIFSGMLYLLVLSGMKFLGGIVPIGGTLFIAGWVALAVSVWLRPIEAAGA